MYCTSRANGPLILSARRSPNVLTVFLGKDIWWSCMYPLCVKKNCPNGTCSIDWKMEVMFILGHLFTSLALGWLLREMENKFLHHYALTHSWIPPIFFFHFNMVTGKVLAEQLAEHLELLTMYLIHSNCTFLITDGTSPYTVIAHFSSLVEQVWYFISKTSLAFERSNPLKSSPGSHSLSVSDCRHHE